MEGGDVADVAAEGALAVLQVAQRVLAQQLEGDAVRARLELKTKTKIKQFAIIIQGVCTIIYNGTLI